MKRIIKHLDLYLRDRSAAAVSICSFFLVAVIGIIDYQTGTEISFSVFYVMPIIIATWYAGRKLGLAVAFFSALTWLFADLAAGNHYSHFLIPGWNSLVRLSFFLIIMELQLKVRFDLETEEKLADTDPLTGLPNRRSFYEQMEREIARSKRYRHPVTIVYLDLDNFKTVNDTLGHEAGDELLRVVVSTLRDKLRSLDLVGRLGGDEFACLFPETAYEAARTVLHHLHPLINKSMQERGWPVTVSIGAVTFESVMDNMRDMIKLTDDLMYRVKKTGKNSVLLERWPDMKNAQSMRGNDVT